MKPKINIRILILAGLLLVLVNVISFAIPIPKTPVFWVCYAFLWVAVVFQIVAVYIAYDKGKDAKSIFFGWPIMRIAFQYLGVAFVLSFVLILMNLVVAVPIWIAVIFHAVFLILASAGLIVTESSRNFVEYQEEKRKERKAVFRQLQQRCYDMEAACKDEMLKKALAKLSDEFRCSDPNSSSGLEEIEATLGDELIKLAMSISDREAAEEKIEKISGLLKMRNQRCMELKR